MQVLDPQPWPTVFLILGVPMIALGGLELGRRAVKDPTLGLVLGPGLGVALWLLAVHTIALISGSFTVGLWAGTVLAAAGGLVPVVLRARRGATLLPARGTTVPRELWICAALAGVIAAPAALFGHFFDELYLSGHMAITSEMLNGFYPPRHLVFASAPLRYHYGFNLLCAMVAPILRLRVDTAIDVVTLACWSYSAALAWAIGEKLLGAGRGRLAAALLVLGGGCAYLVGTADPPELMNRLLSSTKLYGSQVNPPLALYLFQHPWSLGIPMSLCTLAIFLDRPARARLVPALALLLLLLALALSQVTLFLSFLAAMLAAEVLTSRRPREALQAVGLVVIAVLVAKFLGGFFANQPGQAGAGVRFHPFSQTGSPAGNLLYTVASLGAALPLGVVGIFLIPKESNRARLFFGFVVAGSVAVFNLFEYARSWDIVKFATVATLALSIPAAAAVAALWRLRPPLFGRAAAGAALLLCTFGGMSFFGCLALGIKSNPFWDWSPLPLSNDDTTVVNWLRTHVAPGDVVYRTGGVGVGYAHWGGLPQAIPDFVTPVWGFPDEWLARRLAVVQEVPEDPSQYRDEGIRWLVVDLESDDAAFVPVAEAWLARGQLRVALEVGALRVYEVL